MSLWPMLWALKGAPVVDAEERVILIALADGAWSDGTDAFPSKKTIAEIAKIDPKTVQRRLKAMTSRGLIALGNQNAAAYIPEHFRPQVYDLMIPYSWFSDIDQINEERKAKGKPPLTPEDRPNLAEAPAKKRRADKGQRRKRPQAGVGSTSPQGGGSQSPGQTGQEGGTTSPGGGVYKSQRGGLQDPQPSPTNPPRNTPRPSVPEQAASHQTEGGTDGSAVPHQIGRNPGVDLLLAIGAQQPEFLLTGKTLQDQGMAVAGMLLDGWTREQLRQVIAGRSLPDNIRTTVGAVVARRLRDALAGPPPHVGQQFKGAGQMKDKPTPTPASWTADTVAPRKGVGECEGRDGLCGRPTEPGSALCRHCAKIAVGRREDVTA